MFKDKVILLGVSGGIAAYKSAELTRQLKKNGAQVICIMTEAAKEFITPLTLQTLSQNPVYTRMFQQTQAWDVEHISLADKADLLLIAPATANVIGKVRAGVADDFLTTTILASHCPVLMAPAMNVHMYENPITQDNIAKLKQYGYHFVEPAEGDLACGSQGRGRLADMEDIIEHIQILLVKEKPLRGKRVMVTAGPTWEHLDPVRFLTNRSTGKMGYAIARQAYLWGADVLLVTGPTQLRTPKGVEVLQVESAEDMLHAVLAEYDGCDVVIKAAAVSDYYPQERQAQKIKKTEADLTLKLARSTDILTELGRRKKAQILVGFAAETTDVLGYARKKIQEKNLDLIVANDVTLEGAGFGQETNIVSFVFPEGRVKELPLMRKEEVACHLLREVVAMI